MYRILAGEAKAGCLYEFEEGLIQIFRITDGPAVASGEGEPIKRTFSGIHRLACLLTPPRAY